MLIRIGTRQSPLAVFQARQVADLLNSHGHATELVFVESLGDLDLNKPIYELGVQGVFTKTLDAALLAGEIDLAVHSAKDVPTTAAQGLTVAAVLERDEPYDVCVARNQACMEALQHENGPFIIATGSIRRRAQWLQKYPGSQLENLRGNIGTRLQKLFSSNWHGAIFSAAALYRLGLVEEMGLHTIPLTWMLPAPAQGTIMIMGRSSDELLLQQVALLNHHSTAYCIEAERKTLKLLGGGCSTPVSALAQIVGEKMFLKAGITAPDGHDQLFYEEEDSIGSRELLPVNAARHLLERGGAQWLHHA